MCKRIFLIVLLVALPALADDPVGPFQDTRNVGLEDIGIDVGGTVEVAPGVYHVTGGGGDIWDNYDQFQFAYKAVTGSIRLTADFKWYDKGDFTNDWAKAGAMLRYSTDPRSQHITAAMHLNPDWLGAQYRGSYDGGSGGWGDVGGAVPAPVGLGIQRVQFGGLSFVAPIYNKGSGWQTFGTTTVAGMPDEVLYGLAVGSHANWRWSMGTVEVTNVKFEDPSTDFYPRVDKPDGTCPQIPGFKIRSIKVGMGLAWPGSPAGAGYAAMNQLLEPGGQYPAGVDGEEEGTRIDQVVNLYDSGGRGEFSGIDYPDVTFPGIDDWESPASDPAGGPPNGPDDDDNFATEVIACIQLTAGWHVIGANSDDGTIIWIGGVEIGRSGEWKGADNADFLFSVATEGLYSFKARMLEGGGGASLELHEVLPDGTRILLGDTARGGSPVYVPEPATIALLGLGGLSLLGSRRKH